MEETALVVHRYVVGVDGGASKTIAMIGTEDGKTMGRGESGSANYHNVGAIAAREAIRKAVIEAKKRAGMIQRKADIAVVALAAINSAKDESVARRFVQRAKIARRSFVVHDSIAALYAATNGRPGIIVISGTGCVAAGINNAGKYVRAGGWGYLVDDEGSAYDIGRKALNRAFRTLDGRAAPTKLISIFERWFRVKTLADAQNKIYANGTSAEDIARLAPLVARAAANDEACREILENAGIMLGELACTVARRLEMTRDPVTVAIFGGAFRAGHHLLRPFNARVKKDCPRAKVIKPKIDPAQGAFSLAASMLQGAAQLCQERMGFKGG